MSAMAGVQGDVLIVSLPSVTMTDEAFTDSGDHKTYNITNQAHRYLDRSAVFVVQTSPDGTTWSTVSSSTYTLRALTAQIVFGSANASGTQVRIHSGKYYVYASVGGTSDWDAQMTRNMADVTTHKGPGGSMWADYLPVLGGGVFTLKRWWIDETLVGHLSAGDLLILSCVAPDNTRAEGYCYVKDSDIHSPVAAINENNSSFQVDGQIVLI